MRKFLLGMMLMSSLSFSAEYKCNGVLNDIQNIIEASNEVLKIGSELSYPIEEELLNDLYHKNEELGEAVRHALLEHREDFAEEQIHQLLGINETYNNIRYIMRKGVMNNDN